MSEVGLEIEWCSMVQMQRGTSNDNIYEWTKKQTMLLVVTYAYILHAGADTCM